GEPCTGESHARGSAATWSVSTCTRRDLPMPASPLSSTTWPRPSLTCAQRSRSTPISCSPPPRHPPNFLPPPPQGGPAGAAGGFQATAGHTLIEHAIDRQRLRQAFQERR